jgi:hypothetical protein
MFKNPICSVASVTALANALSELEKKRHMQRTGHFSISFAKYK